ncbi:MAG: hypothetical protein ACYC3A_04565 [Halothiobacillus sp.]
MSALLGAIRTNESLLGDNSPSNALTLGLFVLLVLSMAATRYHHFSSVLHIADTSWAVFFIAGLYLRPRWMFPALLGLAVAIDWVAVWVDGAGMSGCFSPAYPGLLLAYGTLWGAGRLAHTLMMGAQTTSAAPSTVMVVHILEISGWLTLGVLGAFALSNLTFWAWSGHFAAMPLGEYSGRVIDYLGRYLVITGFYVGLVVAGIRFIHLLKSISTHQAAH